MKERRTVRTVGGVILAVLAAGVAGAPGGLAADELQVAEEQSGSMFGRVRYLEDGLTIRPAERGEAVETGINAPVTPGDLVVADGGRAEIALADGSIIWLEDGATIEFTTLADLAGQFEKTTLLGLQAGLIRIDAVDPDPRDKSFRIDTAAGSIYLLSGGSYRIEADGRVTEIAVHRGSAEVSGDRGSVLVRSGYRTTVRSGEAPGQPETFNIRREDDFDEFCADRREAFESEQQVPAEVVEEVPTEVRPYMWELGFYGAWHNVPVYGWVWSPVYYGSWAPYWNGYWSWCSTGWVWTSYDAWGWAPYHYGRWDHVVDIGWVWIPGGVWRGAWVSFAVGTGYVGWCPLNYWNRAVFHGGHHGGHPGHYNPHDLDGRGWRFVPTGQFSARDLARHTVRPDRLPAGGKVTMTGRLPRFAPREVAARPERVRGFEEKVRTGRVDLPGGNADRPVPFRNLERSAARGAVRRDGLKPAPGTVQPRREGVRPTPPQVQGPGVRPRAQSSQATPRPRRIETPAQPPRSRPGVGGLFDRNQRQGGAPPTGAQPGGQTTRRPAPPSRPQATPARPGATPARPGVTPQPGAAKPPAANPRGRNGNYIEQLFKGSKRPRVQPPAQPAKPKAAPPPAATSPNRERSRSSGEARGQGQSRGSAGSRSSGSSSKSGSSHGSGSSQGSGSQRGHDGGGDKKD